MTDDFGEWSWVQCQVCCAGREDHEVASCNLTDEGRHVSLGTIIEEANALAGDSSHADG